MVMNEQIPIYTYVYNKAAVTLSVPAARLPDTSVLTLNSDFKLLY